MHRKLSVVLCATLLLTTVGLASQTSKTRAPMGTPPAQDPFNPMASESGLSGLWKVISAETAPAKSFGSSGWMDRINRNPGQMTITTTGTSLFYSFTDRVELGVEIDVNRRLLSRKIEQLGFGQATLFVQRFAGCNGCPLILAPRSMPGVEAIQLREVRTNLLTGRTGYNPQYPFVNRRLQTGFGDLTVSPKINLYSEMKGDRASFALRPWLAIPTRTDRQKLFDNGTQYGTWRTGVEGLLSKNIGDSAGLHFNFGWAYLPEIRKNGNTIFGSTNLIPLRFGVTIPRTTRFQVLGEITSEAVLGQGVANTSFGPATAVDGTIGFRTYLRPWIAVSAGYRHNLNQGGGDKSGFVVMLSTSSRPIPVAPAPPACTTPPTLSLTANPTRVLAGTPSRLNATAASICGGPLTYTWSALRGRVDGTGPETRFDTTGLTPGNYNVTVRVTDPVGFADATATITVVEPPRPNPPTASCSVDRSSVNPGERVTFSVRAGNPDNRPLRYNWSVTGGSLQGTGASGSLDTTNLAPGTYTATVRVSDDRGLSADCSASTTVVAPPARPVMSQIVGGSSGKECNFKDRSSRVDNACKAVLDDVALRMRNESDASSVVVGYAKEKERQAEKLSAERANNVKQYLVQEKGVAENRISVRAASGTKAEVEIYLVPRGASYTGPGNPVADAPPAPAKKPAARRPAAAKPAEKK